MKTLDFSRGSFFVPFVYSPHFVRLVCHLLISGTLEVFVGDLQEVLPGDCFAVADPCCDDVSGMRSINSVYRVLRMF